MRDYQFEKILFFTEIYVLDGQNNGNFNIQLNRNVNKIATLDTEQVKIARRSRESLHYIFSTLNNIKVKT